MKTFTEILTEAKENKITFNGKNAREIKAFLNKQGFDLKQESNGRISIIINGKEKTVFKEDVIEVIDGKVRIIKMGYR